MSMFKSIQSFREQAKALSEPGRQQVGREILALALEGHDGKPHPGAYAHIVVEVLEQAGAIDARDRVKQALASNADDPLAALRSVYAQV